MPDQTTAAPAQPHYAIDVAKLKNLLSGSKTWGPLTVNYNIDIAGQQFTAAATLYGHALDTITLTPQHQQDTLGGSIGIAVAEVVLTADFSAKEINYDVDVEYFGHKLFDHNQGKLFTW